MLIFSFSLIIFLVNNNNFGAKIGYFMQLWHVFFTIDEIFSTFHHFLQENDYICPMSDYRI